MDLTKKSRIPVLATGRRTYTIADVKVKYENFGRRERLPELECERSEWEYFQSLCMKAVTDPSVIEEFRCRCALGIRR